MTIKLVTFDLDNTLWDVDSVVLRAEQLMRGWIAERMPDFDTRFPAAAMMELRTQLLTATPGLRHDLSKLREAVLYEAFSRSGHTTRDARELATAAFQVFYDARHDVVYFPGALETLERLAGTYRLAALTNGNANVSRLALGRFFAFGLSAADVGASKPAPDMFHAALRTAGVKAAESVHVGDHLVDDVQGAADVGMHTIWVNHADRELPEAGARPSHTVRALVEIPAGVTALSG
jgi:2-haloalkanoic acid dehalogenase type II